MAPDPSTLVPGNPGTAIATRIRSEDLLAPVRPKLLLGYLDLAAAGAMDYSRHTGVYLGPWWDLPPGGSDGRILAWKRAVLLRRVEAGAVHLGHMFILVFDGVGRASLRPEDLGRWSPGPSHLESTEIVLRKGDPMLLMLLRPTYSETLDPLVTFGNDLAERFRLQVD
ncbi:MAG: hypothetical protein L3K17_00275 [Thermoplasmata archaeon]|nr:hypothetical protein [Thermoplasmata archaeon]